MPATIFVSPTEANNTKTNATRTWLYVNTTITETNHPVSFIDFNRSLLLWMRLNNESGENTTFFRDWSTYYNNGSCTGTECPIYNQSGKFGSAYLFDGTNDAMNVTGSQINNMGNTSQLTVSVWIKPTTAGNLAASKTIITKWDYQTNGVWALDATWSSTGGLRFLVALNPTDAGNALGETAGSLITGGNWYHVAVVYDGTQSDNPSRLKIYINGENKSLAFTGRIPVITTGEKASVKIGDWGGTLTGIRNFPGEIDEVMIFNRSLSAAEINASFNAGIYRLERNFTNLTNATYTFNAYTQDAAGNVNNTETITAEVGNNPPTISFENPTDNSGINVSRNYILANVTVNDTNLVNITVNLYASNGTLMNSTHTSTSPNYINLTGLSDGTYTFNATANDTYRFSNSTETRIITVDTTKPQTIIVSPTLNNNTNVTDNWIYVNTTITETNHPISFIDFNRSLLLWFRLNNETGENTTFFRDWSTYSNNGTCISTNCSIFNQSGKFGGAYTFDGSDDYIQTNLAPSWTNEITMSAWVNLYVVDSWPMVLSYGTTGGNNPEMGFSSDTGKIEFRRRVDSAGVTDTVNLAGTGWHYIVGTANGSTLTLYKDGVLIGTNNVAHNISSTTTLRVGRRADDDFGIFTMSGSIDEVKILNRTLSAAEI